MSFVGSTLLTNISEYNGLDFDPIIGPPFDHLNPLIVGLTLPEIFQPPKSVPAHGINARFEVPGTLVTKGSLFINFKVDRFWDAYFTFYDWMNGLTPINASGTNRNKPDAKVITELTVNIMDGSTTVFKLLFDRIFPIKLPSISLSFDNPSTDGVDLPIEFKFEYFEIEKIGERNNFVK